MRSLMITGVAGLSLAACLAWSPVLLAEEDWQEDDWNYLSAEDPWENWNRKVFRFNDTLDTYNLRPVARGYPKVTPKPVRKRVRNFFGNLG